MSLVPAVREGEADINELNKHTELNILDTDREFKAWSREKY